MWGCIPQTKGAVYRDIAGRVWGVWSCCFIVIAVAVVCVIIVVVGFELYTQSGEV